MSVKDFINQNSNQHLWLNFVSRLMGQYQLRKELPSNQVHLSGEKDNNLCDLMYLSAVDYSIPSKEMMMIAWYTKIEDGFIEMSNYRKY